MTEPDEPEIFVPPEVQGGVFANDVRLYDDLDDVTIDFLRLDPRDARRASSSLESPRRSHA